MIVTSLQQAISVLAETNLAIGSSNLRTSSRRAMSETASISQKL
jgi:hypothetical protein